MQNKPFIATRELVVFPGVVTPIFIGRQSSLKSLEEAVARFDNKLVLTSQKDANIEEPKFPEDVYETGVLVHIIQTVKMPNGNVKVLVEAKHRVLINQFSKDKNGVDYAEYEEIFSKPIDESKAEALKRKVIDEFSKYAKNWIGTDFSEQMILEARKHGENENLTFEVADATSLSFSDGEFNCVVIANALHIMPEPDEAMREIYRVLKPNGILSAPTFLWKEGTQSKFKKWIMSVVGFKMYQEWNKKQFKDFIEKHGFSVVEMNLIHGGLAPIGVMIAYKK